MQEIVDYLRYRIRQRQGMRAKAAERGHKITAAEWGIRIDELEDVLNFVERKMMELGLDGQVNDAGF